jgi:DNA modification methylase
MMPAPKFPQYKTLIFETWPIERCIGYARNPRKNDHAVDRVASAIREFGFRVPIVAKSDGTVVDGHLRLKAAAKLGLTEVPVILADDLTDAQIKAFRLSVNKVSEFAEWDVELLKLEFADLDAAGFDLSLTGFDIGEIAALTLDATEGLTDPDAVPDAPAVPVTVLGDVWLLGRHRLMCGSSTDAHTVEAVLAGVKPHLMVTDPPYGIEYDAAWRKDALPLTNPGKTGGMHGKVLNDNQADWREAWALFPGDVAYIWHAGNKAHTVAESIEASGFEIRSQIIWAKHQFVIGRGHYHPHHEPCWYAVRKGATGHWCGDRKQSTLWQIPKSQKSETGHSTQKPVECMKRPIENNSSPGQAVYEPFSGSGTTIMAGEMTGRCVYAIELNPAYVDMAVIRWQNFTGQTATLEATGQPFRA